MFIEEGESKTTNKFPTKAVKVAIGAVNTLILTNTGVMYLYGSDEYGQSGMTKEMKREREKEFKVRRNETIKLLEFLSFPYQIAIPVPKKIVIVDIAMGSHHILALTKFGEMYSWGRNDEGQCGHGFMVKSVEIPKVIEQMQHERIKAVYASENFSACLSCFGYLYTCGSAEFGKLGNGTTKDCQSDFELVETNCPIAKVGLGIHHMVAIADYQENDRTGKDGRTLAWGRNQKGQLGIGTRDQCSTPEELTKLNNLNIRLIDVQ